ncbi:hypothetical protein BH23ACI1_BH23ACI1_29680 [soil metagenome]|nr:metallophosphoesterase [Acidobacteriota bacterium]
MTGRLLAPSLAACVLALAAFSQPSASRLVAVADIHGDLTAFTSILRAAGLTDHAGAWRGGRARFVQTGDYTDRGPDVRRIMDLLRSLERSARSAGGRVDVLLGNHEVMNILGIYRDVNPAVYASFADARSEARRERAYSDHRRLADRRADQLQTRPPLYDVGDRDAWMAARPLGFVEHAAALGPGGDYGRWLRQKQVALDADGTILMHAGIDPQSAPPSIDALNRTVRDEIRRYDRARKHLVDRGLILPFFTLNETIAAVTVEAEAIQAGRGSPVDALHIEMLQVVLDVGESPLLAGDGPLWFRGFATWSDNEGGEHVASLLSQYRAVRFIAGHSVQREVTSRFDHRIFLIDTGMLAAVYKGRASALEIAGGRISAIYPDGRALLQEGAAQRVGAAAR